MLFCGRMFASRSWNMGSSLSSAIYFLIVIIWEKKFAMRKKCLLPQLECDHKSRRQYVQCRSNVWENWSLVLPTFLLFKWLKLSFSKAVSFRFVFLYSSCFLTVKSLCELVVLFLNLGAFAVLKHLLWMKLTKTMWPQSIPFSAGGQLPEWKSGAHRHTLTYFLPFPFKV